MAAHTMGLLDFLFGNKSAKIKDFQDRGAIVVDVRSKGEYAGGAIPGSKNIPLPTISAKLNEIKKWNKPVILCCASGMRSGSATAILKGSGIEAMNGGGWFSLSQKLG
ncbi:rhodanese-like domain-containing protein [Ulvibacter antarcticus]|uniref:Rhodanese-related sulfurtransferase n=1 Tax=Ulvibacter antarcticus TaxID=442714 RepID=A0A3L9YBA8_9FLAO|nr:rhodanese-like domain-containing protein [Ulvibacter antarcticus]RMA57634.1 rhodanese-related sulfurtransferase [Ulvibacter antarcticus]